MTNPEQAMPLGRQAEQRTWRATEHNKFGFVLIEKAGHPTSDWFYASSEGSAERVCRLLNSLESTITDLERRLKAAEEERDEARRHHEAELADLNAGIRHVVAERDEARAELAALKDKASLADEAADGIREWCEALSPDFASGWKRWLTDYDAIAKEAGHDT